MEYIIEKNFDKSYFLKSGDCWFFRYCDTKFKEKWNGFWKKDFKFLDYFAVKINNDWLSYNNIFKFVLNDKKAKSFFKVGDEEVIEEIFLVNNVLNINVYLQKNHSIILELGLNFRKREENWHNRDYNIIERGNGYLISSFNNYLFLTSNPKGKIINTFYKDHYPSNEKQRAFVIFYEIKNSNFANFKISIGNEKEALYPYEIIEEKNFSNLFTEDKIINELFLISSQNIKNLIFDKKFIAGLPWFTQVWTRDFCLSIKSLLYLGLYEEIKETLEFILRKTEKEVPMTVYFNGDVDYNSADSNLLLIRAIYEYYKFTADSNFLISNKQKIEKIVNYVLENLDENGFFINKGKYTWQDTLKRENACIELQSFLYEFYNCAIKIYKRLNLDFKELIEKREKLIKNFKKFFINDFFDCFPNDKTKRINFIFPIYFGLANFKDYENLFKEFEINNLLATISKNEKNFNPNSYHEGSSWIFINALYSLILFKNRKFEKAYEILKEIYELSNKYSIFCLPETIHPINKNLLGCNIQLWSSSFVIESIISGLLNFDFFAETKTILLNPLIKNFDFEFISYNDIIKISSMNGKINIKSKNKQKYSIIFKL